MTTSFHLIEEVPEQLEEAFSAAMELILSCMAEADSDYEKDTILLWLLFIPQSTLKCPSRGGKEGERKW